MTDETRPSDRLTAPRRPWVTAGLVAVTVVALSGAGVGAYALAQNAPTAPAAAEQTSTPEPVPNEGPTASFSILDIDKRTVSVDGANSFDPDGEIVTYGWDFGDGNTASGATASHKYGDYGTYAVTLTVTDDDGATGVFSADVTLDAPPPPPPPPAPEPPAQEGYTFGNYPPGYPVPNDPNTGQPNTAGCASGGALESPSGYVCA